MEEVQPIFIEKYQFEYRGMSEVIAIFAPSEYRRKDCNRLVFC